MNIHLKNLPKSKKQFGLAKIKTEIEIKNENGRVTYFLGCVGRSSRWFYLKI
jgi:hypothetical protein